MYRTLIVTMLDIILGFGIVVQRGRDGCKTWKYHALCTAAKWTGWEKFANLFNWLHAILINGKFSHFWEMVYGTRQIKLLSNWKIMQKQSEENYAPFNTFLGR